MLDMGFRDEMVYIIGKTAKEHQTLFFPRRFLLKSEN